MNLTPEEKQIGKENFSTAIGMTRRGFLKRAAAAGVVSGAGLGAFYFGYGAAVADPVRVGVIGTGDEGNVLIGAVNPEYVQVVAIADIRPYSIHRAFHGDRTSEGTFKVRRGLLEVYGWKTEDEARKHVKVYDREKGGYAELIKNAKDDGVEAVIIALPLHMHAAVAIEAMNAGLHVLTEKLMGHSVHECKDMARVAARTNRYLVTGHQRHYNVLYANAMDTIQNNLIGDIHFIRAQWHRANLPGHDSWKKPLPTDPKLAADLKNWKQQQAKAVGKAAEEWEKKIAQLEAQIRDEVVDAQKWGYQGYTKKEGYSEEITPLGELIRWRLFNRTGGGLMAELGSHQLDAASIFISAMHAGEKQKPLGVVAAANRPVFPRDRDVDDHVYCIIEFPGKTYYAEDGKTVKNPKDRIAVAYSSINGNEWGGYGEVVMGTAGTLILEREKEVMLYKDSDTKSKITVAESAKEGPALETYETGAPMEAAEVGAMPADVSRGYTEEIEHWAWCIREDPDNSDKNIQPRCHPKVAMADAIIALSSNIAAEKGTRIEFKDPWFEINDNTTPEGVEPKEPPAEA